MTARAWGRCPDCGRVVSGRTQGMAPGWVALSPHPVVRAGRIACLPRFSRRAARRLPDGAATPTRAEAPVP